MATVAPYLNLVHAHDALTFYQSCFGGKIDVLLVRDTPVAKQMPPESQNKVMHSSLTSENITILISEMSGPEGFVSGNTVSLMLNCTSEAEVKEHFDKLSPDGKVMMAPQKQFWGDFFAAFTDKFGVQWLMNYEIPKT